MRDRNVSIKVVLTVSFIFGAAGWEIQTRSLLENSDVISAQSVSLPMPPAPQEVSFFFEMDNGLRMHSINDEIIVSALIPSPTNSPSVSPSKSSVGKTVVYSMSNKALRAPLAPAPPAVPIINVTHQELGQLPHWN